MDFCARTKIGGTHMKYHVFKQLPVLPPSIFGSVCEWRRSRTVEEWIRPRTLELLYTAVDVQSFAGEMGYDGPPFIPNDDRRFRIRCELDAAFFHLYGIERDDVDYIMEQFPIVKRKDERAYGEYRTKNTILRYYDRMQEAMDGGDAFVSELDPPPGDDRVTIEQR